MRPLSPPAYPPMERQQGSSHWRITALLSIIVALPLIGCIYDSDKRCGNGQVVYTGGVERCVCDPNSVSTPSGCVACGTNEMPGASGCVCKSGHGRSTPAEACAPCGANEVTDLTGACICDAGFARTSPQEACAAITSGPGASCNASTPCSDPSFSYCRAAEGTEGYCTSQACTTSANCSTGYTCDLAASPSFCARPPTGLGNPCTSDADCAGNDATYCDLFVTKGCLVQGCSLSPDNCPEGYECCDLSAYMIPKPLCVSIALGGCVTP
jgi:hypothetical protein